MASWLTFPAALSNRAGPLPSTGAERFGEGRCLVLAQETRLPPQAFLPSPNPPFNPHRAAEGSFIDPQRNALLVCVDAPRVPWGDERAHAIPAARAERFI
jgi:hypothetical protein